MYDPFDRIYHTVPAQAVDYTAQLSLWKHRVICDYVRREQTQIDLAALGRARRKIQDVVDAALSRKSRPGGRKAGRWQTGGQPPSLASGPATPAAPAAATSAPLIADVDERLLTAAQPEDGWGITYAVSNRRDEVMASNER